VFVCVCVCVCVCACVCVRSHLCVSLCLDMHLSGCLYELLSVSKRLFMPGLGLGQIKCDTGLCWARIL
jgi:hypothetical protein